MAVRDLSFDPGTNHTGYCVWEKGRPIEWGVFNAPQKLTFEEKVLWHIAKLTELFERVSGTEHEIGTVAVEGWEKRNARMEAACKDGGKESMKKCATVQGMCFSEGASWGTAIFVGKGTITKAQTEMLAKSYGVTSKSKDALDAFQIGVCAGFDRRKG